MTSRLLSVLAALLLALPAWAQVSAVRGEHALAPKAAAAPQLRLGISPVEVAHVRLEPVADSEVEAVRERNTRAGKGVPRQQPRRATIGIARTVAGNATRAANLRWIAVPGGYAAQVAVTSPDAGSLRLAIELAGVAPDVEMVFVGSADTARIEGPVRVGEIRDRTLAWWSPLTEGATQTVEFFAPARLEPTSLALAVTAASHVFTTPSSRFTKRVQDIGLAGSCNVDIPCSTLASDAEFRNVANSTAQMVFSDGGFTAICTGTLLADADTSSQTPWLYSANHCFENEDAPYKTVAQLQVVANTLITLWGFEASACNSAGARTGWSQIGGGATVIYNNVTTDVLFLRLGAQPPTGAFYSGWDASALASGSAVTAVHHPQGDLKKVSVGSMTRFASVGVGGGSALFIETRWTSGTTEEGSSGGGIWTRNGTQYAFRGALWGGAASCSAPSGNDYFSRFDQSYPNLSAYLGASSTPVTDYTDLWWNPSESGWGLNLIQHPSRVIFGVWYTYELDGSRTWYVLPSGAWTGANTYTGTLYSTAGPPFNAPFNAQQVEARQVGSATITFSDANNGVFTYSVDGLSGSKSITRQPF